MCKSICNRLSHFGLIEDLSSDSISLKLACTQNPEPPLKEDRVFCVKSENIPIHVPFSYMIFFFMFHHVRIFSYFSYVSFLYNFLRSKEAFAQTFTFTTICMIFVTTSLTLFWRYFWHFLTIFEDFSIIFSGAIRRLHKPSLWPPSDLKNSHSKVPTQKIFVIWSSTFQKDSKRGPNLSSLYKTTKHQVG